KPLRDNMANENVPAPAPTRSDDQILPFGAWVPIEKSNYSINCSASVPAIYIQQFWNTFTQEAKTGVYCFQLDEDWFTLDANLLREALEITPIDQAHQFESPFSGNAIMDFLNELGYTEELHFVSRMAVYNLYQPWKAILSMINQCLTRKTSGKHNINQRSGSPFVMAKDDHRLGNLKFVPKGEEDEVFRMKIPKELITNNIRNAPYYNAYLEMVAKHDQKIAAEEGGKKKSASKVDQSKKPTTTKQPKPVSSKQSKPAPAKQPKHVKEKSAKPSPVKKAGKGEEVDYNLQQEIQMSLESSQPPIDGVSFREPASVTEEASTGSSAQLEDDTSDNMVRDTPSPTDAETCADTDKTNSEGQAGSDLGKTPESRPPLKRVLMEEDQAGPNPGQSQVALAGPNPEPMHDDFVATVYPRVHESLKLNKDSFINEESGE
ncbi:hypothetical protein Tco_1291181, partial [Tanacetum coccineum]